MWSGSHTCSHAVSCAFRKYRRRLYTTVGHPRQPLAEGAVCLVRFKEGSEWPHCELEDWPLGKTPSYNTLSYAWDNPDLSHELICNGTQVAVPKNAHDALLTLRTKLMQTDRLLWVDILSINQEDSKEKARGIRQMGQVIAGATEVMVWLGHAADKSDSVLRHVDSINETLSEQQDRPWYDDWASGSQSWWLEPTKIPWNAIGKVFNRSWWHRLWTFQEAALARNISIFCGSQEIVWDDLIRLAHNIRRLHLEEKCRGNSFDGRGSGFLKACQMNETRLNVQMGFHMPYSRMIDVAQTRESTDPRDRVYGIMALGTAGLQQRIPINYGTCTQLGTDRLYIESAKAGLELSNDLRILEFAEGSQQNSKSLPSWCPDLRMFPRRHRFDLLPHRQHGVFPHSHLMAGKRTGGADEIHVTTDPQHDIITVRGLVADRVSDVVSTRNPFKLHGQSTSFDVDLFKPWEGECRQLARDTLAVEDMSEVLLSHIRVLVAAHDDRSYYYCDQSVLRQGYSAFMNDNCFVPRSIPEVDYAMSKLKRAAAAFEYGASISTTCADRSYFSTRGKKIGIGPLEVQNGDIVAILYGGGPLFILRPCGSTVERDYKLVGAAYIDGLMHLEKTLEKHSDLPQVNFRIH